MILNSDSTILLYGAAYMGTVTKISLEKAGYMVSGYIDKRADEIDIVNDKPVYSIQEAATKFDPSKTIVFIAVKNVYEHSRIAARLEQEGFFYIICIPEAVIAGQGTEEQKIVSELFQHLCEGKYEECSLPMSREYHEHLDAKEIKPIDANEDGGVYYIPITYVAQDKGQLKDLPVVFLYPHIEFFRTLNGEMCGNTDAYIEYCKKAAVELNAFDITPKWTQNVLKNRSEVFERMNDLFNKDPDALQRNATKAIWNDKGFFNIVSGKHRMAFFTAKRMFYIPLRISDKDIKSFFDHLDKEGCVKEIEDPRFYGYYIENQSLYYNIFFAVAFFLSEKNYNSKDDSFLFSNSLCFSCDGKELLERFCKRFGGFIDIPGKAQIEFVSGASSDVLGNYMKDGKIIMLGVKNGLANQK